MLISGTSIVDISPQKGIELAGYPHFPRYNEGIHDPLYGSCIYLYNGKEKMIIMAVDLLFLSRKYIREIRERIYDNTGIPQGNILISVSHTHSGPWAAGRLDFEALEKGLGVDKSFVKELKDKLIGIAVDASLDVFDASIGYGSAVCGSKEGIGGNRRNPDGPSDPAVQVIGIKDNTNNLRAAIVKYSLHPTVLHEDNTLLSADYPGYIREYFRKTNPGMNFLFMQGTSGDQSTRYFRKGQDFGEARRIGYTLGEVSSSVIGRMVFNNEIELKVFSKEITLPLKELPSEEDASKSVKKARSRWQSLVSGGAPYIDIQNANLENLGAESTLGYARLKKKKIPILLEKDELPSEVMVLVIGDIRIVGLPGEVFVEFGREIHKGSPYNNTIVVELANGCLPGYVCTEEAIKEGGYEVGTSMLAPGAGRILVEAALKLLFYKLI